jgi:6-phosphogluconolactonase
MIDKSGPQKYSRRHFLGGTAALAVAQAAPAILRAESRSSAERKVRAYVGSYTTPVDGAGNGDGIYLSEVDSSTGELSNRRLVAKTPSPSWLALHPSRKFLYSVNEIDSYEGKSGSVTAFAIDSASGDLRALNTVSSQGATPAHMSLDANGKFAFVANYGGGSFAVLPIRDDGFLGDAVDVHRDTGSLGSIHATNAPPGSFAISGHDAPHAHMIAPDPANRFVHVADLGQDRIYSYNFDSDTGKLTAASAQPFAELPTGDGPRHFVFHPNGRRLYSIQEESSTITSFDYDPATGALKSRQTISTLPPGFAGTNFPSEIVMSHDGRFVYGANRLHDSIAVFAIGADGKLSRVGETPTMGDYPRHCNIDPAGRFFYSCNQHSDCITCFRIHPETGALAFTGRYTAVGSPAFILFAA